MKRILLTIALTLPAVASADVESYLPSLVADCEPIAEIARDAMHMRQHLVPMHEAVDKHKDSLVGLAIVSEAYEWGVAPKKDKPHVIDYYAKDKYHVCVNAIINIIQEEKQRR